MASYTVITAKHATLAANTADTVTFAGTAATEILNRSDFEIYVSFGTATVGGDDCFVVPARTSLMLPSRATGSSTVVSLISSGAAAYSVTFAPR